MSNAERAKIVNDLMRGALMAARHDVPDIMVGKTYLIVDDDRESLDRITTELQQTGGDGLEISTARTAAVAQEICTEHDGQFDVVLVNHKRSPGQGHGFEMLELLRRAGLDAGAVVLLYADKLPRGIRKKALAAGFADAVEAHGIGVSLLFVLTRVLLEASDGEDD